MPERTDWEAKARGLLRAEMARQNIRYAEVTFSPSSHRWINGIHQDTYFTGLTRGRKQVKDEYGVEINWVFDIVRNAEHASP